MANSQYAPGAFFKSRVSTPDVLLKKAKHKAERNEWARVCGRVDERDKKRCFVTGARLSGGAVDPWLALERHHIRPRSVDKGRRFNANNVVTVSRAVHQLLHAGVLRLLDKRGQLADRFDAIDALQWDRSRVSRGDEPCRVRRGLAVSERHVA